jgi:hypothetical protein
MITSVVANYICRKPLIQPLFHSQPNILE